MARPKGHPKTGGRQKGVKNKKVVFLREEFDRVGFDWGIEFMKAYQKQDFQRLSILNDLIPYLVAKLKDREIPDEPPKEEELTDESDQDITQGLKVVP